MMTEQELDAPTKEALEYWGYLFKDNKTGTDLLHRFLSGIYNYIIQTYEPITDCTDATPSQLAAFYRAVGGDYDVLFVKEPPSAIAFIYKSLGCLHSLQPIPNDEGYAPPAIPALKRKGFITWQTIQLLLGPEEHVEFLQSAVSQFDITDPSNGTIFPKLLPKQAFPDKPDENMIRWYENVSEKLRKEALAEEKAAQQLRGGEHHQSASDVSGESSADERSGAATYFRDPLYRNQEGRPTIIRRFSKNARRSSREFVQTRGRMVANTVRHFVPVPWRRKSLPEKEGEGTEIVEEDDATPVPVEIKHTHRRERKSPPTRVSPVRRESFTSTESDSDAPPPRRRRDPVLRHRRSHEIPPSPREYFPDHLDASRRYSHAPHPHRTESNGPPAGFAPSREPMFATTVAQHMHPHSRRPSATHVGGRYKGQYSQYSGHDSRQRTPIIVEPPELYENGSRNSSRRPSSEIDRDRHHRERDRERDRERERERDRDRERDRERDRHARPRVHRYVTPVDGVSGRRYPNEAPWR